MYVEGVERSSKWSYTSLLITCLIFNGFLIRKSFEKLRLRAFQPHHPILCILKYVENVKDYIMQHYMESTHYIGSHVEDVKGVKYYE